MKKTAMLAVLFAAGAAFAGEQPVSSEKCKCESRKNAIDLHVSDGVQCKQILKAR